MFRKRMLGAFLALGLLWIASDAQADQIKWVKSLKSGIAEAKKTRRLIMIDFFTDWCGWCKRLDKDTYTSKPVVKLAQQMVSVKLNAEDSGEGTEAAKKYRVNGFPTILFINSEGTEIGRIGGYMPPGPFAQEMDKYLQVQRDAPLLESKLRQNPRDGETAARLARIYAAQGNQTRSAALIKQSEGVNPRTPTLAAAYHALGDTYQLQGKFNIAIPLFRKAIAVGKTPYDLAYSHISVAVCYLSQRQWKAAVPELKATIAVPNCPKELKDMAQVYLGELQKQKLDR